MSSWNLLLQFIEKHSVLSQLLDIIFGSIVTLVAFFFRQIAGFLARVAKWSWAKLRGRGKNHDFEKAYLDWLIGEHRHLGLLPAQLVARQWKDRRKLVELENVYVSLAMSTQSGDEQWAETYGHGENSWRRQPGLGLRVIRYLALRLLPSTLLESIPMLTEEVYLPGELALVVDRHKRLIIRGDPGSGKTTLLRYLAVTCARALRNNKRDGDSQDCVKKRLLWTERPFPILVRLRRHGNVASWDEAKELTATMLEEMPSTLRKQCPADFFERRLRKGKCLILLDAFDELGSPEARATMARKLAGFLAIYKRNDNRIVVTTRIVGYEGQLDRYNFTVRTVQNLQAGEIRALVKQRYKAIATSETVLRSEQESRDVTRKMMERAERLIEKIENAPRLNQLATNPMLLSLIVLVHSVKVELPEERLLLYRDCVEILAESWQQFKREELGIQREQREELTFNQKLVLLRKLAIAMQRQRKDEGSLALMPSGAARELVAQKLADLLGAEAPQSESASRDIWRKAEAWIAGIQTESGILVEQGLDETGEPVIGFSHLTFQEYLAAVAIHEERAYQSLLRQHLLQPAWQEVVLLYAALTNDATSIINGLLTSSQQPRGVLLAGRCLAERLKKVGASAQQMTLEKLKEGFCAADDETVSDFGNVMGMLGGSELTTFLRQQLSRSSIKKRLVTVKALGQTRTNAPELEEVRADLVRTVETATESEITVAAREALAQVGDPRFTGPEPTLVRVPTQTKNVPALMRTWKDLKASPAWMTTKSLSRRFAMLARVADYWLFTRWCALRRRQPHSQEFEIAKYPVTNIEYSRFIEATGHAAPSSWKEGTFPRDEASHPVAHVTKKDAEAYCTWLSHTTGKRYRLPTEWEWEWAAAGPYGWKYPWGDQFDKERCNSKESGVEGTTPVGSYVTGNSLCGVSDMSGNVWEITSVPGVVAGVVAGVVGVVGVVVAAAAGVVGVVVVAAGVVVVVVAATGGVVGVVVAAAAVVVAVVAVVGAAGVAAAGVAALRVAMRKIRVLRGGAWNTPCDEATCFYRTDLIDTRFVGFRCVREVDPAE